MSSFGIPSGPGRLLLLSLLTLAENMSGHLTWSRMDTFPYSGMPTLVSMVYGSRLLWPSSAHGQFLFTSAGENLPVLGPNAGFAWSKYFVLLLYNLLRFVEHIARLVV